MQLFTEQALQPCLAPELGWDTNFSTGLPWAADFVPRILLYSALLAEAPEHLLGWEAEGKDGFAGTSGSTREPSSFVAHLLC